MAEQDRSDGWIEGYAQGLVDGLGEERRDGLMIAVLHSCTCGVMSGGVRVPSNACEVHGGR
jgi:hypothetical protein